jgi:hypothetical protein
MMVYMFVELRRVKKFRANIMQSTRGKLPNTVEHINKIDFVHIVQVNIEFLHQCN